MSAVATSPASVRALVHHRRLRPFTYEFSHRTTMWLVDAAEPNAAFSRRWLRPFASIRSEDHFAADDDRPLITKVRSFLDAQELPWTAHRVLVLTNARSLGYVFDPLTTYFCFDARGELEGVLAEVHNTYGERHCYPLSVDRRTGEHGQDVLRLPVLRGRRALRHHHQADRRPGRGGHLPDLPRRRVPVQRCRAR